MASSRADDAIENGLDAPGARPAEGHDDPGNDEGGEKQQQRATDAGDNPQRGFSPVAELRLQALNECRQIRMGLRPQSHGPSCRRWAIGNTRRGGGNLQRVVAEAPYDAMNGISII